MILGRRCTRACAFCALTHHPCGDALDTSEPQAVAQFVAQSGMRYCVLTSVSRDDLPDRGAGQFAASIRLLGMQKPRILVEALVPDFDADTRLIKTVLDAGPSVFAHNLETVPRLYERIRPQFRYRRSLRVLEAARRLSSGILLKSSLLLGLGETESEVEAVMQDLVSCGCQILSLGQYLAPSPRHYPVCEFIAPGRFVTLRERALNCGFKAVVSGPLVRSSYAAVRAYEEAVGIKSEEVPACTT